MENIIKEIAFSNWNSTKKGSSSVSEDKSYSCTLFKEEGTNRVRVVMNINDGLTNPRDVTLYEVPEEKGNYGVLRTGKEKDYMFLLGSKNVADNKKHVYVGNIFPTDNDSGQGRSRLVVRVREEDSKAEEQQQQEADNTQEQEAE